MRTRIEGLVQLKTGDAMRGVISRRAFFWRFLRVDNAVAIAAVNPAAPAKVDGTVWVPKANVSFIQELHRTTA